MERLFDYLCPSCGHVQEAWRHIDTRKDAPPCDKCGGVMEHSIQKAHRPALNLSFPGEDLRNNRDALKELERSTRLINASKQERDFYGDT